MKTTDVRPLAKPSQPVKLSFEDFRAKLFSWQAHAKGPDDRLALPGLIDDLLATCPESGRGVHLWFPKAVYRLAHWPFRLPGQEIHDLLEKAALARGRKPKPNEIADAINFVLNSNSKFTSKRKAKVQAQVNKKLEEQARSYRKEGEEQLFDLSSIPEPWNLTTYEILSRRFPVRTLLCVSSERDQQSRIYRLIPSMAKVKMMPKFMVPNAWIRQTEKGHYRLQGDFENTWWYQITEFDFGTRDEQASKILWLKDQEKSPELSMVVWSAGKSLHAWWNVRQISNRRRTAFLNLAISIGADPAHKTINQLTRTPNAIHRENQRKQSVIYLL